MFSAIGKKCNTAFEELHNIGHDNISWSYKKSLKQLIGVILKSVDRVITNLDVNVTVRKLNASSTNAILKPGFHYPS